MQRLSEEIFVSEICREALFIVNVQGLFMGCSGQKPRVKL